MRLHPWALSCVALPLALLVSLAASAQDQPVPATPAAAAPVQPQAEIAPSDDPDAAESAATKVPLDEIRRYVGVYNAVREAYVDPVSDRKLMQSAIKGLLLDLDPHSAYLEKSDAQAFDEETNGAYAGIGVEVQLQPDGRIKVIAPIDDTPAARAGIKSGDIITAVDGKPLSGEDDDSQGPLRGASGTKVTLTLVREGVAKPFDVSLQRETIRVASVRSRMLEPGFGYVRVAAFQADTAADFEQALEQLQRQAGGSAAGKGLRGLVLDLRSNPGGVLGAAVSSADVFLDGGVVTRSKGRLSTSNATYNANPGDELSGAPIVVLVDSGTASAAEVLAGALQDNHRATLMGSRTFGKGSIQSVVKLANGDAVKMTTGRYYTPSGRSIQAHGLTPDRELKGEASRGLREQDLPGHLAGDDEAPDGYARGEVLEGKAPIDAALVELKKLKR
jgi:carboxyl-terminal processing protease